MAEVVVFVIASAMALTGAVGVVVLRNPVHAALSLVLTLFGVAVHFVAQEAHFLAVVQVVVYAGAIVVLILFVIMLLGVDRAERLSLGSLRAQRPAAAVFAVGAVALVLTFAVASDDPITGARSIGGSVAEAGELGVANVDLLARSLFGQFVYAFELTSALLVVAVVAAVVLARRHRDLAGDAVADADVTDGRRR